MPHSLASSISSSISPCSASYKSMPATGFRYISVSIYDSNDNLADYLIEVIDELHVQDNAIDFDQKSEPRNPQVGEIWASTK